MIRYILTCGFIAIETMNNIDFAMVVLGVIGKQAIYRLKQTWEKVEALMPGKREAFQKLMGGTGKNVATLMNKCSPPLVPYVGLYMQQIVNSAEAPSKVRPKGSTEDHLNIFKFRVISGIVCRFESAQQVSYNIAVDPRIQRMILQPVQWVDENSLFERSYALEPPHAHQASTSSP
jgi:hypothetical protein